MKIEETDGMKQAHKIATATMCSAKVQATIGTQLFTWLLIIKGVYR